MSENKTLQNLLKEVNSAPSLDGWRFSPVALVQVVNELQRLDERQVIEGLRTYVHYTEGKHELAKRLSFDIPRVFLILRLLYVTQQPGTLIPPLALGQPDVTLPAQTEEWPHLPLALSLELPFLLIGSYFVGGALESAMSYLDKYAAQGQLRRHPLIPTASPVDAVEALLTSTIWHQLASSEETRIRAMVFGQALRAAAPAYVADSAVYQALANASWEELAVLWQQHAKAIRSLRLRWDFATQSFKSDL